MIPTVLVVDDRSINREFLATLLTSVGYRVIEAHDGTEALDLVHAWHPHLVISDILMPTMDGVQLVRGLRAEPNIAHTPVIFYTATYRLAEAHALARSCGVSTVIAKPAEPESILRAVADVIGTAVRAAPRPAVVGLHAARRAQQMHVSQRLVSWARRDLNELKSYVHSHGEQGDGPAQAAESTAHPFARVQALAMRLSALIELGMDISTRRQADELIELFCRAAQDIVNARYAGIVMLESDGRRVRYFTARGLDDAQTGAVRAAFDPNAAVAKQLLGGGGPQRLCELDGDPTAAGLPAVHPPFNSFLAVPVQSATRMYGLLYLAERLGADAFGEDDEQLALTLAWQLAPAYENLVLYEELRRYAGRLELEIAERRRTAEWLQENQQRYRLLWETTTDAVLLLGTDNRIQHANPAVNRVFGYEPHELVDKDLAIVQPERLREAHRRAFARYLATGTKTMNWRGTETTACRRDGSEFPVEIAFSELVSGREAIFAAYVRDITERRSAETALRESQSFLEQSQKIGGIGGWMAGIGDDTCLWWSPETYRIFGLPEGAPLTRKTFAAAVHPDDRQQVRRALRRAVHATASYSIDHRIVLPDGGLRWVHERAEVIADPALGTRRFVGVVQDITEQRAQQDKIARLTRIYAVLSGINSAIIRVHEREALFTEVCRVAVHAGRFPFAWVGTVDRRGGRIHPAARFGDDHGMLGVMEPRLGLDAQVPQGLSLLARAVRERRPVISNDVEHDPRVVFRDELRARGIHSIVVLPLIVSDEPVAVLAMHASEAGFFNDDEMKLLAQLADDIAFGLRYIDKVEQLDYLAYYDALTGLANSTLFHDRLHQLLQGARPGEELVAVMVLDLDRFTRLNDTLGRHVCDRVLQIVSKRLGSAVSEPSSVARIGADTFAVAVGDLHHGADAAAVLRTRILEALVNPMRVDGREIRVSARAGIALYPGDGTTAAVLFKNAEAALQQARASGQRYLYYSPEINASVADKLALENRLRRAAEHQQFVLHYQPKLDAQTGRLVGLEALLRWNDPDHGLVLPENFIDELEETGLILDVGAWVLDRALDDYHRWRESGLEPPRVAVNVSPLQLRQADFADSVRAAVEAHAIGPQALEIELTESLIMEDIDASIETLRRMNDIGVTSAVDDFGTGYSSLRYLAKLPVDSLKIDSSFIATMVDDDDSMTIVSTIISLAHSLGLRVVAEGVENNDQASVLRRLGCDEMQGHLYSEAVPPERIAEMLRRE